MAVKATDSVTLASITDVSYMRRYYLLQLSNLAAPAVPTTNPPAGSWGTTEPTYTEGATNSLYVTDLVVFSDTTFDYLPVQLSSSYEAAKVAYNKALAAENAASQALREAEALGTVRTNFVPNPKGPITSNLALTLMPQWFGSGGTGATVLQNTNPGITDAPHIDYFWRKTWTNTAPQSGDIAFQLGQHSTVARRFPVTPGEIYTTSYYLRHNISGHSVLGFNGLRVTYINDAGTTVLTDVIGGPTSVNQNTWVRVSGTFTVPNNSTITSLWIQFQVALPNSGNTPVPVGSTLDGTGFLVERGSELKPYFDGSTTSVEAAGYAIERSWMQAANVSPSVETTYPIELWRQIQQLRTASGVVANLLQNPGFEMDYSAWSGWASNVQLEKTVVRSGTRSAKLTSAGTSFGLTLESIANGGSLPVTPGELLTISAWAILGAAPPVTGYAEITLLWIRSTGGDLWQGGVSQALTTLSTTEWREVSTTHTAPANATHLRVSLRGPSTTAPVGTILYWDDASVTRKTSQQVAIDTAQTAANAAQTAANTAQAAATTALTSANGRNSIITSTGDATGTTNPNTGLALVKGDQWTKVDSLTTNNAIASWYWDGEWKPQLIKNELIHSLDVTKLTAAAAHIQQAVINQLVADIGFFNAIVADSVTAQTIATAVANIVQARVENLTVTAGATINSAVVQKLAADIIVAQVLRTSTDPSTGLYALMDNAGFRVMRDNAGIQESVVHLGPTSEGLLTLGTNPSRRITLDNNGGGSFHQLSAERIIYKGESLSGTVTRVDDQIQSFHQYIQGEVSEIRRGVDQIMGLDAYVAGGYVYRIEFSGATVQSIGTGEPGLGMHITTDGSYPGNSWTTSIVKESTMGSYNGYRAHPAMWYDLDLRNRSGEVHIRAGITLRDWLNVADCRVHTKNNVPQFEVTRRGDKLPDRGTRSVGELAGAPPPPPPQTAKTRRVVTFKTTGWANYQENGAIYNNSANAPSQGDPQSGVLQTSCFFFDSWREIMQGKTIYRISLFTWADYWYYNDGGVGRWHTHTAYGSIPGTQPSMQFLADSPRNLADANYNGDFWKRGARGRWDLRPDQFGWFRDTVRGFGFHASGNRDPRLYGRFSAITGADSPTLVEIDMEGVGNW